MPVMRGAHASGPTRNRLPLANVHLSCDRPGMAIQAQGGTTVMGLDPGLQNLGWGVIRVQGTRISHVANGIVHSDAGRPLAERLLQLFDQLTAVVSAQAPDQAAVEQTFVNRDGAGTLKLGQARAIALLVPARAGIPVGEYAPNAVKKAVVGVGLAAKEQVDHMVRLHLPGVTLAGPDAADALAVAICHAHHLQSDTHLSAAIARAEAREADQRAEAALGAVRRRLGGRA